MILLQPHEIEKLQRRKRRAAKRMKPIRSPKAAERDMQRRMRKLWADVLKPVTDRIVEALRRGARPGEVADLIEGAMRQAEVYYGLAVDEVVYHWQMLVDRGVRASIQRGLNETLGIDISSVLDTPHIASALDLAGMDASRLIKTIPGQFLDEVARVVAANFRGDPIPEGRTLQAHIQHLGKLSERRARVIARDQTSKLTGALNRVRQESIGVTEYIWRTVKDNRVVGNPLGIYPKGNDKHGDHHKRNGHRYSWAEAPHDGHPGSAIQCRCWAEPVLNPKKIMAFTREG